LGLVAAYWTARWLGAKLYGASETDPVIYALAVVCFLMIALLASWLPARRASTNEPIEALRQE